MKVSAFFVKWQMWGELGKYWQRSVTDIKCWSVSKIGAAPQRDVRGRVRALRAFELIENGGLLLA